MKRELLEEIRRSLQVESPLVERLRLIKTPNEIAMIRNAARYADRAVEQLLDASYRGATVAEGVARTGKISRAIVREHADWEPLTTRVLMATWAAPRSAQPHSVPSLRDSLRDGPHVALAFLRVNGYAAESERTYFTTKPTPQIERAFRAMVEARNIALRLIRPGVACAEIDAEVRAFLEAEGYAGEEVRLHRTGHGIGLGNHEAPWIAEGSQDVLAENMVVSIEPGIYLQNAEIGGYRHSDTVLVTRDGHECLTRLPTDIQPMTLPRWKPATRVRGALVRYALRPEASREVTSRGEPEVPRARRRLRAAGWLALAALGALVGVISFKTIFTSSKHIDVKPIVKIQPREGFEHRLAKALRIPTFVGEPSSSKDPLPLEELRKLLEVEFPRVHQHLEREVFGQTLLFRWKGTDATVEPVLLMSHIDVVPVEAGTEKIWTHPPFSGEIADGFIWGRGTLDVKSGAIGLLEAADLLLAKGFQPSGDVYFVFGHDEETGGREGNLHVAEVLRGRGVRFRFVLDEGGSLTEGIIDGIGKPVAFVGIAEKGYATIKLTACSEGGHSSMPPPHTAVGLVATAVAQLESNPFPARIDGATAAMLDFLGPEMPLPRRVALANRWLTGDLISRQFTAEPSLNALIRTTMAATVIHGGEKENVLPQRAQALVNLRLLPGDTPESALRRIDADVSKLGFHEKSTRCSKPLTCSLEKARSEPSAVSSIDSDGFRALHRTITEVYPAVVVSPGLSMVATDSRYYAPIASDIYRFLPLRLTNDDLKRIHGVDERIGIKTYEELIGFLARLIENLSPQAAVDTP